MDPDPRYVTARRGIFYPERSMKSWKTTILGIVTGIGLVANELQSLLDADPATEFSLAGIVAGLAAMGIGWFARDNDKRSEDVGA